MKKLCAVSVVLSFLCLTASIRAQDTIELVVLHIKNTHGTLTPYERNGRTVGGIGPLSTLIKQANAVKINPVLPLAISPLQMSIAFDNTDSLL